MKSFFINSVLVVFSIFVALLLAEFGLRIAGYGSGNPFDRLLNNNDEYVGYRMIPGVRESIDGPDGVYDVEIVSLGLPGDERGFRDDGLQRNAKSLFFGDSFVWGFGVEIKDSISEHFERLSGEDAVNLGMTAFTSPTQYYRLFRQYGPMLRANYAFFGVFIGNDFNDSLQFDRWLLSGKRVSYPEWRTRDIRGVVGHSWTIRIRRYAYKHSVLWRFVADRLDFGLDQGGYSWGVTYEVETANLDLVFDSRQLAKSMGRDGDLAITLVRRALRQIKRVGESIGTRSIVFVIPTKEQVYASYLPADEDRNFEDVRYPILLELLEETGIEYVDLLPAFRQAVSDDAEQMYFRVDGHWNTAGHEFAASELYRYVNENPKP